MANNIKFTESGSLCMINGDSYKGEYKVDVSLTKDDIISIKMRHVETRVKFESNSSKITIGTSLHVNLSVEDIYHILVAGLKNKDKNVQLNGFCTRYPPPLHAVLELTWTIPNDIGINLTNKFTFLVSFARQDDIDIMKDFMKDHDKELESIKKELENVQKESENVKQELRDLKDAIKKNKIWSSISNVYDDLKFK